MEETVEGKIYDGKQIRRLLPYAWPYRATVALSLFCLTIQTIAQVLTPLLTRVAIDKYISHSISGFDGVLSFLNPWLPADTGSGLVFLSALFATLLVLRLLLEFGQQLAMQYTGQRIMFDLRKQLFQHLQRLDINYYDRNPVGRLVTRVTTDVDALNEFFSAALVTILGDLMIIAFILVAMLRLSWPLTLILLAFLPFVLLTTQIFRKRVSQDYRRQRVSIAKLNSFLSEHISGMTVLQLFNREARATAQFETVNEENKEAWKRSILAYGWFYPMVEFQGMLALAGILAYGGWQIREGTVTIGILVAFLQFAMRFFGPIQDLSEKYNILQSAMAASERVFGLLDEKPSILPPQNAPLTPTASFTPSVTFEGVSFAYKPGDWILEDLSFHIEAGETIAIVGHTGAGKTTITNLMLRFYDVQKGSVKVSGTPVQDLAPEALRSHFGVVLQDPFLFTGSLRENIRLGDRTITDDQIEAACRRVNLWDFIVSRSQGLDTLVQERGAGLSTGQKQLVSFARALVRDPRILILDEATSSVDTETEQKIQSALDAMLSGRTAIVIAHRLSTIQRANRIFVMHKGHLRECGTHQELLRLRGIYWRLYQLQYKEQDADQATVPAVAQVLPS